MQSLQPKYGSGARGALHVAWLVDGGSMRATIAVSRPCRTCIPVLPATLGTFPPCVCAGLWEAACRGRVGWACLNIVQQA